MTACRELEADFGLRNGADTEERNPKAELKKVDASLGDVRHQIGNTLKAVLESYRSRPSGSIAPCFPPQYRGETGQGGIQRHALHRHCLCGHG